MTTGPTPGPRRPEARPGGLGRTCLAEPDDNGEEARTLRGGLPARRAMSRA